jgi:predicted peptidase
MRSRLGLRALPALALAIGLPVCGQTGAQLFEAKVFENAKGEKMPYRLFTPQPLDSAVKYPLVLWLHGIDDVGSDNLKQISDQNFSGPNVWVRPAAQAKYPCFVLAPQCPFGQVWATPFTRSPTGALKRVVEIVDSLGKSLPIDADRIYVVGQSLGGFGTWALITTYPDKYAAAVPVCGGGNATKAAAIAKFPIWAFHDIDDPIVLVFESRAMISAIRKAGGNPRYTEFKSGLHNAWDRAFNEPELADWLFAQKRANH